MKRIVRMNGVLRKKIAGGLHPTLAERSARKTNRSRLETVDDVYLHEIADKFDISPQEVFRRGVAMFVIAAEAEQAGNSVVVLNPDNVVVHEYTDFRTSTSTHEPRPIKPTP